MFGKCRIGGGQIGREERGRGQIGAKMAFAGGLPVFIERELYQTATRTERQHLTAKHKLATRRCQGKAGQRDQRRKAESQRWSEQFGQGQAGPLLKIGPF